MKSIVRGPLAVVMAGMFVLLASAQTQNDAPVPQQSKPVTMYRFYAGKDGLSHVEKIEVTNFDSHGIATLMTAAGAEIHRTKPDPPGADFGPYHPGPHRQYIFDLMGHEEIEFSGGGKITLNPGDIELVEDLAPAKGHRNLNRGPDDRVSLWVPITDQTIVRDSILKPAP